MKFGVEEGEGALYLRVRVSGTATVHDDHPTLASYPGAQRTVEVKVRYIFPNCPRYVPHMELVEPSRHIPKAGEEQPVPA